MQERKEEDENELKEYMSALAPIQFATKTFPESGSSVIASERSCVGTSDPIGAW